MCRSCTTNRRSGDSGPNKTSDGIITGPVKKLDAEQVAEMRKMWSQFKSRKEIAAHFHITPSTVGKYMRRSREAQS